MCVIIIVCLLCGRMLLNLKKEKEIVTPHFREPSSLLVRNRHSSLDSHLPKSVTAYMNAPLCFCLSIFCIPRQNRRIKSVGIIF